MVAATTPKNKLHHSNNYGGSDPEGGIVATASDAAPEKEKYQGKLL